MRSRNLSFQRGGSRIFRVGIPFIVSLSRFLKSRRRKKKRSRRLSKMIDVVSTGARLFSNGKKKRKQTYYYYLKRGSRTSYIYIYIFPRVFYFYGSSLTSETRQRLDRGRYSGTCLGMARARGESILSEGDRPLQI